MEESFDPYLKWLGIPPKDQPPHHYRLLGIEVFESDPDVIANAADQRMSHLKNFAAGKHSVLSQKILNEIAAARVCLLDEERKAAYDGTLQKQNKPKAPPRKLPKAVPAKAKPLEAAPVVAVQTQQPRPASAATASRRTPARGPSWPLMAAIGGGAVVVVVLLAWALSRPGDQGELAQRPTMVVEKPPAPIPSPDPQPPAEEEPSPVEPEPEPKEPELPAELPPFEQPPVEEPPSEPSEPPAEEPVSDPPPEEPKPEKPPAEKPPAEKPPEPPSPSKPAVPDEAAVREARKEVREILKEEFEAAQSPEQKLVLADTLSSEGLATKDNPAMRFALLQMACEITSGSGDLKRSLKIIDDLGGLYDVNVLKRKAEVLTAVAESVARQPTPSPATQRISAQIVSTARELFGEALRAGELRAADQLLKAALTPARRMRDRKLIAELQQLVDDVQQLKTRQDLVEKAMAALASDPGQPQGNLVAGSWFCFVVGDWEKGLPMLVKSGQQELADAARQDLAAKKAAERAKAADLWWDLAENKGGIERQRLRERATGQYRTALPGLSGFHRTRVEKRLDETGVVAAEHALQFDGTVNHVIVSNFGYAGGPITVEAIVRPSSAGSSSTSSSGRVYTSSSPAFNRYQRTVISNGESTGLRLMSDYGTWSFKFYWTYTSTSYVSSRYDYVRSQAPATLGKWIHLAGVFDGRQIGLYVDGQLQGVDAIGGPHRPSTYPFIIGATPQGTATPAGVPVDDFFLGDMKAVRISNTIRYMQNFQPPEELTVDRSTKLLFRFNEGRGEHLKDASSTGAVGQIKGQARWIEIEKSSGSGASKPASTSKSAPSSTGSSKPKKPKRPGRRSSR